MPKKAKKATSSKDALPANTPSSQHAPNASFSFPILQFTSVLGTYTLLLIFVALYLPRSTTLLSSFIPTPAPRPQTSLDRPEHPFLVPLTANPELTLSWVCLGSWVLVAWWGGWVRGWRRSERKEKVAREARTRRKIEAVRNAWVATMIAIPVYHVFIVLFGAPIASHIYTTSLLATLLALLTVYPSAYALPFFIPSLSSVIRLEFLSKDDPSKALWLRLFSEISPNTPSERILVYSAVGTLAGCWVGAFPLPLDWDRPWQAWPLIPAFGATVGHIIGLWCSFVVNSTLVLAELVCRLIFIPAGYILMVLVLQFSLGIRIGLINRQASEGRNLGLWEMD